MTGHYTSARDWAHGPDRVYGELARAAVALLPGPLDDRLVLDAGAGTGAVTRAMVARHARVVAIDLSADMLGYGRAGRPPGVVGDVVALPLRDDAVDLSVAAFVLSHLDDPGPALAELARVTRGSVLATAFPVDRPSHPVKVVVDEVLRESGYTPPDWYTALKGGGEARVGTPDRFTAVARNAGLSIVELYDLPVPLSTLDHGALVDWRLGMAQVAPWLSTLDTEHRTALRAQAIDEVTAVPPLPMLVLEARGGAA